MQSLSADVVVIGSGCAGLMAAIAASQEGMKVLVLTRGALGKGTNSSMVAGLFNAVTSHYSPEEYLTDTLQAGKGINNLRLVQLIVEHSSASLARLKDLGVPLNATRTGFSIAPAADSRTLPGVDLMNALGHSTTTHGIRSLQGFHVLELVVQNGRTTGVLGVNREGHTASISASAIVLATGGGGAIYRRNDNAKNITGDGYALALRAGCRLRDMEFVQFYPLGLCEEGVPETMVYPPYPPGTRICDAAGRDLLRELGNFDDVNLAITHLRDRAALFFFQQHQRGELFMDLTDVPAAEWQQNWALRLLDRYSFDFRRRPCRIAPLAHFFMGGVAVDLQMRTGVDGLFAAGEVVGGMHGANRLGGNALTECIVEGLIAGRTAAEWARQNTRQTSRRRPDGTHLADATTANGKIHPDFKKLFAQLGKVAWQDAGIIRDEVGLRRGMDALACMEDDLSALSPRNAPELRRHSQLRNGLLVLRCILAASLCRKESRGSFFRTDYPAQDDPRWRCNIHIHLGGKDEFVLTRGERQP